MPDRPVTVWRPMGSAPNDGRPILILTADFGVVEGWWDRNAVNFYKSQKGSASYDPGNMQGDWVSDWTVDGDRSDRRLYCGATPRYWMPKPDDPPEADSWLDVEEANDNDRAA